MWKGFLKSTLRTAHVLLLLWGICSAGLAAYLASKLSVNVEYLSASLNYAQEESANVIGSKK